MGLAAIIACIGITNPEENGTKQKQIEEVASAATEVTLCDDTTMLASAGLQHAANRLCAR
jgi:hypothetical protein